MALHLKNKETDLERKHRVEKERISYENKILRDKLLDASIPTIKSRIRDNTIE